MIYFDDLDAMGVVHNGRYVTLLERVLAAYWTRADWPYDPGQPASPRRFYWCGSCDHLSRANRLSRCSCGSIVLAPPAWHTDSGSCRTTRPWCTPRAAA